MVVGIVGTAGATAVTTAADMRAWAASHGVTTIHSIMDFTSPPAATSKIAARWPQMAGMVSAQPALGEEVAQIAHPDDLTVKRTGGLISVLTSPALREALTAKGIKSLIVCGLTSSGVVLSTSRAAYDEGYVVTVGEDACADRTESVHEVVMRDVLITAQVAQAEVVKAELGKVWGGSS